MPQRSIQLLKWIDQALADSADATIGFGTLGMIAVLLAYFWGRFGEHVGSVLFLLSIIVLVILTIAIRHAWTVVLGQIRKVIASHRPTSPPDRQGITTTSEAWLRLRVIPNLLILGAASLLIFRLAFESGLNAFDTARCLTIFYIVILTLKPLERRVLRRLQRRRSN